MSEQDPEVVKQQAKDAWNGIIKKVKDLQSKFPMKKVTQNPDSENP